MKMSISGRLSINFAVRLLLSGFFFFTLKSTSKATERGDLESSTAIQTISNYLGEKEYNPNQLIDLNYSYRQIPMNWEVQSALLALSQTRLSLARNEIYARHGYPFKSIWGQIYSRVSWYHRASHVDETQFTQTEKENVSNIANLEKSLLAPATDRVRTETYDPEVQAVASDLVDEKKARNGLRALEALAVSGNTEAQCLLGYAYEKAEYPAKALPWLKLAANDFHPGAQSLLSSIYWNGGSGVPKDRAKSDEWTYKAALQGKASSQKSWANRLPEGAEKISWLMRAAQQGEQGALMDLSARYFSGKGVKQDKVAAYMYLTLLYSQIDDTENKIGDMAKFLTPDEIAEAERQAGEFASNGIYKKWGFSSHTCTDAVSDPEPVMSLYVQQTLKAENIDNNPAPNEIVRSLGGKRPGCPMSINYSPGVYSDLPAEAMSFASTEFPEFVEREGYIGVGKLTDADTSRVWYVLSSFAPSCDPHFLFVSSGPLGKDKIVVKGEDLRIARGNNFAIKQRFNLYLPIIHDLKFEKGRLTELIPEYYPVELQSKALDDLNLYIGKDDAAPTKQLHANVRVDIKGYAPGDGSTSGRILVQTENGVTGWVEARNGLLEGAEWKGD